MCWFYLKHTGKKFFCQVPLLPATPPFPNSEHLERSWKDNDIGSFLLQWTYCATACFVPDLYCKPRVGEQKGHLQQPWNSADRCRIQANSSLPCFLPDPKERNNTVIYHQMYAHTGHKHVRFPASRKWPTQTAGRHWDRKYLSVNVGFPSSDWPLD